ncbi:hypothetical protein BH23BAC1_BH23BAC1_22650 [soil metagenome]
MNFFFFLINLFLILPFQIQAQEYSWLNLEAEGNAQERHENGLVRAGDKIILLGGRGMKPMDIYEIKTKKWSKGAQPPFEAHHMQAVSLDGLVYVVGAFTGPYPFETPLSNILIYDPEIDTWAIGPEVPADRRRGAAGVVTHDNKIYVVCGIINGHTSGWVNWLDEFDPATNQWKKLPNAPRSRDHVHAAVIDDKIYMAGGRRSGDKSGFAATVKETDVYDIKSGKWTSLPSPGGDIPTTRAGSAAAVHKGNLLIMGGESGSQELSHNEVEMLDVKAGKWTALKPLQRGRHGTQAVFFEDKVVIGAGSGNRGGGPELNSFEVFAPSDDLELPSNPTNKGDLVSSVQNVSFKKPSNGSKQKLEIENKGGNQAILISYVVLENPGNFELQMPVKTPFVLAPGKKLPVEVLYKGNSNKKSETLLIIKSLGKSAPLTINVSSE